MYADISQPPAPLPKAELWQICPGLSLLPPLSRLGHGPGIILLVPDNAHQTLIENGVPSVSMKWAEEGYAVAEVQATALAAGKDSLTSAIKAIQECEKFDGTKKIGLVAYTAELWNVAARHLPKIPEISGVVIYAGQDDFTSLSPASVPVLCHLAGAGSGKPPSRTRMLTVYIYASAKSDRFAVPFQPDFSYSLEAMSHTRSLSFLKPLIGGPFFDLEALWEEHTYYEFADRSVAHTLSTMVEEPYVNHVPTLAGGLGRLNITAFYRDHFIFSNSADTELDMVSRTVGIDRVIDEFIIKFTHDREIDWLLPGVPPTGLKAEVPFTAVVNIRGDRLYNEHISWDQGTLLRQLGLLPEYLPFPYPLPGGRLPATGHHFEYQVPVAGIETAQKMRDRDAVVSNQMMSYSVREIAD